MRKSLGLFAMLVFFTSSLYAGKIPFKVSTSQHYNQAWNYYSPEIKIVSTIDGLTVKSIIANRGNCKVAYYKGTLKNMKYGTSGGAVLRRGCELLSIRVDTNKGSWEFEVN